MGLSIRVPDRDEYSRMLAVARDPEEDGSFRVFSTPPPNDAQVGGNNEVQHLKRQLIEYNNTLNKIKSDLLKLQNENEDSIMTPMRSMRLDTPRQNGISKRERNTVRIERKKGLIQTLTDLIGQIEQLLETVKTDFKKR
jgi:hypothetical protein